MSVVLWFVVLLFGTGIVSDEAVNGDVSESRGLNENILKWLEKFKKEMPCGFPDQGIPPLAPFERDHVEWTYENLFFSITEGLHSFRANGLDKYEAIAATFSPLTLRSSFDISFPMLHFNGKYTNGMTVAHFFGFAGRGTLDFMFKDLRFRGKMQLASKDKRLYIKDFDITPVLGDIKTNITGIIGGRFTHRFVNSLVQQSIMFLVKHQTNLISETTFDLIVPIANDFLKNYTVKDLLDFINSADEPVLCSPHLILE